MMKKLWLAAALAACSGDDHREAPVFDAPVVDAPLFVRDGAPLDAGVPDAADPALSCAGGVRPSLGACVAGDLFADCGGTGGPVLGCSSGGQHCTWFTTGCAAAGYVPSPCPAQDVCCFVRCPAQQVGCIDRWPFPDGRFFETLYRVFFGLDTLPWDRTRAMDIVFNVDPQLPDAPDGYQCEGIEPIATLATPCHQRGVDAGVPIVPQVQPRREGTIVAFSLSAGSDLAGWFPFIEIDTVAARARMCAYRYDDLVTPRCLPLNALCASSGTVTLSALPTSATDWDNIHGHLDVQLSTLHLTADF